MARSIRGAEKRGRGRPKKKGGAGIQIGMRWPKATLDAVEVWSSAQNDAPGRPEAIRRLVELALSVAKPPQSGAHKGAGKAKAMAGAQIERMSDPAASEEERQKRK